MIPACIISSIGLLPYKPPIEKLLVVCIFPRTPPWRRVVLTHQAFLPFFAGMERFAMFRGSEKWRSLSKFSVTIFYMHLTDEQITQFQNLYKKHFGSKISRERAYEEGIKLVRLMQLIYKPIQKKDYQKLQQRRKKNSPTKWSRIFFTLNAFAFNFGIWNNMNVIKAPPASVRGGF